MIGSGAGPVVYGIVASHWFDKRRGLALGLMMFGLGAGALVMPLLGTTPDRTLWLAYCLRQPSAPQR